MDKLVNDRLVDGKRVAKSNWPAVLEDFGEEIPATVEESWWLKNWKMDGWIMNSWWSKLQPGHVMMVQPRFSIELFNHHDSSALTIGNHLVYGMKCFKAMNWVQEDYTRGSKTILEVKSQFPSMLVPAACFHDFWCAKYEYCMATRYLPVGRMVTKAIRPTEGTKIIFVSSCVGLLCHLSWHLPASGNHPSHQRWLWRWWRRGLHQLIDEDPDFFLPVLVRTPFWWPCRPAVTPWPDWYSWSGETSGLHWLCRDNYTAYIALKMKGGALRRVKKTMFRKSSPSTWGGGTYILSPKGLGDSLSRAATMSSA